MISFAAIEFDVDAIEAEIVVAVVDGVDPIIAAKEAVTNAIRAIISQNPNYPGGTQALNDAIFEALAKLHITGLDDTDLFIAVNHALGNTTDPALEAYESSRQSTTPKNVGSRTYGPGGKPQPASPT